MPRKSLVSVRTAFALGLSDISRVLSYRLRLRLGIHPVQRIGNRTPPRGPFFAQVLPESLPIPPKAWLDAANYFGWFKSALDDRPPTWNRNPIDERFSSAVGIPWWTIADFDENIGDIKAIWEASRFDWVVNLSQQAKAGIPGALERLNAWLTDWSQKNTAYLGANWKCAQEASIRVLHLAVAGTILGQKDSALPALREMLTTHLKRIEPTIAYAMAQENNHGTSEAAALFVGGSWLKRLGSPEANRWERAGRDLLENRAGRLVESDGSFSQYSVNYHRLMLDAFSVAEVWRTGLQLPDFSARLYGRIAAATDWLYAMVDATTGDAPNLGANDGANLLPLTDADYRDYRPSVQLAAALFHRKSAYDIVPPREHLEWLGVTNPGERLPSPKSKLFADGGYAVLRSADTIAVLRFPRFKFRPGHADALHVELWVAGQNLLRDGGTFSYNTEPEWLNYFAGVSGHNTVQFDDRDQMPRLGRFLWGDWLKTKTLSGISESDGALTVTASYQDSHAVSHVRVVELRRQNLKVSDHLSGFDRRAVLRWRLRPGSWKLHGTEATDGDHALRISASVPVTRCEIVAGWESRYYLQKTVSPVLEVELSEPGSVHSHYHWSR